MENSNFLYYRQMMKIKSKHITNPSLYSQLYTIPSHEEPQKSYRLQKGHRPDLLATFSHNDYVVQKINNHAFKIVKRKQRSVTATNIK